MASAASRFYERSHSLHVETGAAEISGHRYAEVVEALAAAPAVRALELGYGTPASVSAIAAHVTGEYHIVDVVDRTQGHDLPPHVRMHVADLDEDFRFEPGSFDCVIAMMVVEHLYDPFHSFREIARVAAPGARVFMNLPNIASLRCRLQLAMGRMPVTSAKDWFEKRQWDGNHLHAFTVADVRRIGALFGLELVKLEAVGRSKWLKQLRPSLLCHEITYVFTHRPTAAGANARS